MGPKTETFFVRYSREFVITVIVLTEFDCIFILPHNCSNFFHTFKNELFSSQYLSYDTGLKPVFFHSVKLNGHIWYMLICFVFRFLDSVRVVKKLYVSNYRNSQNRFKFRFDIYLWFSFSLLLFSLILLLVLGNLLLMLLLYLLNYFNLEKVRN